MVQVLFIVNPVSGGLDKDLALELIDQKFAHTSYSVYLTTGDDDKGRISELLEIEKPQVIVAGGGDGTIAMLADLIKHRKIALGILPLGSANGLATELEIPTELDQSLDLILKGTPKPFDLIEINDRWHVLHLADVGLNATLVKRYQQDDHRGFLGYALSAIKELPNVDEPMALEIIADSKRYSFESHFLGIANAKKYGTGVVINPEGKVDDGRFELCILKEISFARLLDNFVKNGDEDLSPFTVISARHALIKLAPHTDFQIDGEYMGEIKSLEVKVADAQLHLIY